MRTPKHWQKMNFIAAALYLPGCLYALASFIRIKLIKSTKVGVPVICIGNLTAGGSGKTPVAISVAKMLRRLGKNPFFVSRGYGGRLKDVVVDINKHSPQQVGDEPLLLAEAAPVVVNHKRVDAAQKAICQGADVIVMDDGFQNPQLYKDKSLLVIDGSVGMGNLCPIPSGPMREFLALGLKRADGVVLIGPDKCNILPKLGKLPVFRGDIVPVLPLKTKKTAVAFAGIGNPKKFYNSLEECGVNVIKRFDFPDHHFYSRNEIEKIIKEAAQIGADVFTTSKDMVKIPVDLQKQIKVLNIEIKWQDEQALENFVVSF